ncbi:unnamed protein product [Pleuronectes platessa]|uniref:Uncharacterized protein n=1 Tax=Pleuronectes platessa TaxID=8262 RepID=A0A9N7TU04_PLEPL|nr:unnamed protein product [Pleuronectes platessa]
MVHIPSESGAISLYRAPSTGPTRNNFSCNFIQLPFAGLPDETNPFRVFEAIKNEGRPSTAYRQTDRSREHLVIIPVDELPPAGLSCPPQPTPPPISIILLPCR